MKVRNKGVDVTVIADKNTVHVAFAASRTLVVCGISTAVLEATCLEPIDTRTLAYYERTTPCFFAMNAHIMNAVAPVLRADTRIQLFDGEGAMELVHAVRQAVR